MKNTHKILSASKAFGANGVASYHSCFFVQVDSDWSNAIGQHRYEKNENLDDGDPVGEVGPMVAGVAP